ncbi:MAG: hypothetical protein J6A58_06700 [Oscillospiraceae bacterium]|nr:hypothetical protein [Oscillospiraceae bacterium]
MDKKFETLTDLYKDFGAFRLAFKYLHKAHSDFMRNEYSRCYAGWNDEAVQFAEGVLYTALCLEYIDGCHYEYFVDVLSRYKSYHSKAYVMRV